MRNSTRIASGANVLTRSRTRLAIGAAAAIAPLAAAVVADARPVTRCKEGYCIYVDTTFGNQVQTVEIGNNDSSRARTDVYAKFLMLDRNGGYARKFTEKHYPSMPKANQNALRQNYPSKYFTYCDEWINVPLPNGPTTYPCATWDAGHRLSATVYENGGRVVNFDSEAIGIDPQK